MPLLHEGVEMTPETPAQSRPPSPPVPFEELALRFGPRRPEGRRAPDGSHWCICCDTTIANGDRAAFCETHRRERNAQQQRRRRTEQDQNPVVGVPSEIVDLIVERTDALLAELGRASAEFNRPGERPPVWVDDLMLIAKELTVAVDRGLRPQSSHRRQSVRARRAADE